MSKVTSNIRQLVPGIYQVFDGGVDVGEVYAEGTAGSMVVEHWVLLDGFESPTGSRVMKVAGSTKSYSTLAKFMTAMQVRIDATGKPGQYIKATCDYQVLPVS